jgi:hypothetical protein
VVVRTEEKGAEIIKWCRTGKKAVMVGYREWYHLNKCMGAGANAGCLLAQKAPRVLTRQPPSASQNQQSANFQAPLIFSMPCRLDYQHLAVILFSYNKLASANYHQSVISIFFQ